MDASTVTTSTPRRRDQFRSALAITLAWRLRSDIYLTGSSQDGSAALMDRVRTAMPDLVRNAKDV